MSLLQMLTDLFDNLFRSSSPEVQKKQRIRKIENELKALPNGIYRNGLIQPNFAEILRVLYINTRPIYKILEATIAGPDIKRNTRFEFQLIVSGYEEKWQLALKDLEYEPRKQEVVLADLQGIPASRIFDDQKRRFEKLLSQLNSKEFLKMDSIFVKLKQLVELCRFNFITPLKAFDPRFNPNEPNATPNFSAVAPIALENVFLDLYYIIADFQMNMSVANAIIALAQIIDMDSMTSEKQKKIVGNLKKIEQACHNILNETVLSSLIRISKQNPDFTPQKASYTADARQRFSSQLQDQFSSEENRIKSEIKDEKIKSELGVLFNGKSLISLTGYNDDLNELLLQNSSVSFTWMTPLKILKTFTTLYYTEPVKTLLNDIVIEGFFNNPNYKSQFSQTVFSANEVAEKIQAFENSFAPNGPNNEQLIKGYIRDSHKDSDFSKKLVSQVDGINVEAKSLIQRQVSALFGLYHELGDLLQDAKKPSCEIVQNLKVLMMSSRNRDSTDYIENNYEKWKVFFDIMRNYAIITTVEKK
ncbi:MAG: DUF5312 domain-containing protein [Treponema sp.]|uniref:DUF5312 family protein n=1 Tax=Treponema sp. TaxID=166 RepID=UPI00298EC70D|nr:DUF5312 family protein [Treponema sp.]MCQ2599890.1 DUF5312 domain-containing protein [Treponema sp.]